MGGPHERRPCPPVAVAAPAATPAHLAARHGETIRGEPVPEGASPPRAGRRAGALRGRPDGAERRPYRGQPPPPLRGPPRALRGELPTRAARPGRARLNGLPRRL